MPSSSAAYIVVPSAENVMLRLDIANPLASMLFEVWKFSAKLRTTPPGVIRTIRPPSPGPGVMLVLMTPPVFVTVTNSGPCTGTRIVVGCPAVAPGTVSDTERPVERSATKRLPAFAGGSVIPGRMRRFLLLMKLVPAIPAPSDWPTPAPPPPPARTPPTEPVVVVDVVVVPMFTPWLK